MAESANDLRRSGRIQEFPGGAGNAAMARERSFVRPQSQHQQIRDGGNKRRSVHNHGTTYHQQGHAHHQQQQQQQRGVKPSLEIYRPPNVRLDGPQNKLNVHAKEFTMAMAAQQAQLQTSRSSVHLSPAFHLHQQQLQAAGLHHSKSNTNVLHMRQQAAAQAHAHHMAAQLNNNNQQQQLMNHQRQPMPIPLLTSASSAHILQVRGSLWTFYSIPPSAPRVQFKIDNAASPPQNMNKLSAAIPGGLQRSKSMSSADALSRGLAGMGLGLGDAPDIGQFSPEMEEIIRKATEDPNQLSALFLMELSSAVMQRAVESQRYALPAARLCIVIIALERQETFLESLVNTCRQWYQERDKVLRAVIKGSPRNRFTAFMAFLMEMYSQLKRRQLQLKTQYDGVSPPIVLLTLLCKCCEDCVKHPVTSLSEIECLFFVLTCIGRDLEVHLTAQLEVLLGGIRDAFLHSSAEPGIRRTLLQLIELQASHWQLPGPTVLYYYPSSK